MLRLFESKCKGVRIFWATHIEYTFGRLGPWPVVRPAIVRSRNPAGLGKGGEGQALQNFPRQAQFLRPPLHRTDTEVDVVVQFHAQFLRAVDDVVAAHRTRESFVLHFLADRFRFHFMDAAPGLHERDRGDEAGQFVTCEQSFFESRNPRHPTIVGVR